MESLESGAMTKIGNIKSNAVPGFIQPPNEEGTKLPSQTPAGETSSISKQQGSQQLANDRMGLGNLKQGVLQQKLEASLPNQTDSLNSLQHGLKAFSQSHRELVSAFKKFGEQYESFRSAADNLAALVGANSPQDQLLNATKQMQETQMSFNLQYLQLQSQMQHENRSYTAISNIMKTKHDTAKNSISNVR
jgi:hypothetical protein